MRRSLGVVVLLAGCSGPASQDRGVPTTQQTANIIATERGPRGGHLVMIGEDGARVADLTRSTMVAVRDNSAAWSPDGRWVVFESSRGRKDISGSSLWIVEAKVGVAPRRITSDESIDKHPSWTPDSKTVVFASQRKSGEAFDLFKVSVSLDRRGNPYGGEPERLTNTPKLIELHPTLSPDGLWVAYMAIAIDEKGGKTSSLWKLRLAGGQPVQISQGPTDMTPAWSPEGGLIAFVSRTRPTDTDLFTIKPDGSGRTHLIKEPLGEQTGPRWSHGGRWLFSTSIFRQWQSGKALHASVTYIDTKAPARKRRLCALQDPVAGGARMGPALAPKTLNARTLRRCKIYKEALRGAFADEIRRKMDQLKRAYERSKGRSDGSRE